MKFFLEHDGKYFPPKYVISLANKYANGKELDPSEFSGGRESNSFLERLGFDIVNNQSEIKPVRKASAKAERMPRQGKRHDERCPRCKETVRAMLEKIFGQVKANHKFDMPVDAEHFQNTQHGKTLSEIYQKLENHRGKKGFVRTKTLPHCDFFVPEPGFVVEFDESQHFTLPRRIALEHYPVGLKLGFDRERWMALCARINARDNDPHYRDEQRAWYDTLRDFLPAVKGMKPTVRLCAKDMRWCSLDPKNTTEVAMFRNIIERKRVKVRNWVATVLVQSDENYNNKKRLKVLSQVADRVSDETDGDGVMLFPGGWFSAGNRKARSIYQWVEQNVKDVLKKTNIIACVGIDGRETDEWSKDQIGVAISKKGIIALGRKFHPAPKERNYVELASDHLAKEEGYSRIFELGGKMFFICACYDSFGLKHKDIPNFGIDVVLDLVHGFYPRGKAGSGDVYFAKNGFAGTSKHWGRPVFGAAVFFNRTIPKKWPSGVYWNQGKKTTQRWRYDDNPLKPTRQYEFEIREGIAQVRIFPLRKSRGKVGDAL